nr:hypothetical protein Iba_chr11aCG9620 [Ipomoea batatas]
MGEMLGRSNLIADIDLNALTVELILVLFHCSRDIHFWCGLRRGQPKVPILLSFGIAGLSFLFQIVQTISLTLSFALLVLQSTQLLQGLGKIRVPKSVLLTSGLAGIQGQQSLSSLELFWIQRYLKMVDNGDENVEIRSRREEHCSLLEKTVCIFLLEKKVG